MKNKALREGISSSSREGLTYLKGADGHFANLPEMFFSSPSNWYASMMKLVIFKEESVANKLVSFFFSLLLEADLTRSARGRPWGHQKEEVRPHPLGLLLLGWHTQQHHSGLN